MMIPNDDADDDVDGGGDDDVVYVFQYTVVLHVKEGERRANAVRIPYPFAALRFPSSKNVLRNALMNAVRIPYLGGHPSSIHPSVHPSSSSSMCLMM